MGHHHPTPNRMATFSPYNSWGFYSGNRRWDGGWERGQGGNLCPHWGRPLSSQKGWACMPRPPQEPHLNRGICVSSGGWSTGCHKALPDGSPQFLLWSISTQTGRLSSFYLNLSICFCGMLSHFLWACALSREGQLVTDFCIITLQILKDSY